jgi:hypothetical protein
VHDRTEKVLGVTLTLLLHLCASFIPLGVVPEYRRQIATVRTSVSEGVPGGLTSALGLITLRDHETCADLCCLVGRFGDR